MAEFLGQNGTFPTPDSHVQSVTCCHSAPLAAGKDEFFALDHGLRGHPRGGNPAVTNRERPSQAVPGPKKEALLAALCPNVCTEILLRRQVGKRCPPVDDSFSGTRAASKRDARMSSRARMPSAINGPELQIIRLTSGSA